MRWNEKISQNDAQWKTKAWWSWRKDNSTRLKIFLISTTTIFIHRHINDNHKSRLFVFCFRIFFASYLFYLRNFLTLKTWLYVKLSKITRISDTWSSIINDQQFILISFFEQNYFRRVFFWSHEFFRSHATCLLRQVWVWFSFWSVCKFIFRWNDISRSKKRNRMHHLLWICAR